MADRQVGASYSIWLCSQTGARVQQLAATDWLLLDYARSTNAPGTFTLELVSTFDMTLLKEDAQLEILRTPYGGVEALETTTGWFIQSVARVVPEDGAPFIRVTGVSALQLLERRTIPLTSKTAKTGKKKRKKKKKKKKKGEGNTDNNSVVGAVPAGDAILRLARDHIGKGLDANYNNSVAGTDAEPLNTGDRYNANENSTGRDLETPGYLDFMAFAGHGADLKKKFGWRELWECVLELVESSDEGGEKIAVDVEARSTNPLRYRLKTYAGQRGTNRTATVTLSPDSPHFNITDVEWGTNYAEHVTLIYLKKPTSLKARPGTLSLGTNPYGRREALLDVSSAESSDDIRAEGDAALKAGRSKKILTCAVVNTPTSMYGQHWFWGDKVSISVSGQAGTAIVAGIHVQVSAGEEDIDALIEVDD